MAVFLLKRGVDKLYIVLYTWGMERKTREARNNQDIAVKLREIQKRTGLTQAELAVRLGVTFAALNRWMNGHAAPRPRAREQIEAFYAGSDKKIGRAWEYDPEAYATQAKTDPKWNLERKIIYGLGPGERLKKGELIRELAALKIPAERKAFLNLIINN